MDRYSHMFIYDLPFIFSEKLQSKYSELGSEIHVVDLERGSNGLGISLAGNRDLSKMSVFVVGIQPESPTAMDGRIQIGDELLEVRQLYHSCQI